MCSGKTITIAKIFAAGIPACHFGLRLACPALARESRVTITTARLRHRIIGLILISFILAGNLFAGAWTQRKDHYYLRISGFYLSSHAVYDNDGNRDELRDNGRFTDFGAYAYLEYGLSDLVTFVGSAPYKRLRFRSDANDLQGNRLDRTTNGFGDVYLGLRYLLSDRGAVTSLQAAFKMNTGYQTDTTALSFAPPLGDGQNDFELRALVGQSVLRNAAYYNVDVGYRVRGGAPVDEIPFAFEAGLGLGKVGLLIGQIYGVRALSGAEAIPIRVQSQTSLNPVEDYIKAHAQVILHLGKGADVAFIYEDLLAGRNTADGRSFGVALAFYTVTK
jgi:hypothetical protein